MPEIEWSDFSWEAFATLIAGLAAVSGAVVVAIRQQKILKYQATIERLKLRSETFDRRWEVYRTTAEWLLDWWNGEGAPNAELKKEFAWSVEKSKFLFRPVVHEKLRDWQLKRQRIEMLNMRAGRKNTSDEDWIKIQKEQVEIADELQHAFSEIGDLFGEDMRMSEHHSPLEPLLMPPKGNFGE